MSYVNLLWGGLTIPAAGTLNGASSGAADRQLAVAGSRSCVPLVYGEDRIGALILNVLPASSGSTSLLVQCLWGFSSDSINDVYLNGLALPAGSSVTSYTGSQVTADSDMVTAMAAQSITYADTLNGYAYSVVSIPIRAFDGRLSVTARVRGRKLYDPRKDSTNGGSGSHRLATPSTWEWSDNPALALGDFCYSVLYGLNRTVNWASAITQANACDAMVGGSEKRRLIGVSFVTPAGANDIAETLRAHAGCFLLPGDASGLFMLADADGSSVATYAHASGQIADLRELSLRDLGNSPTAVEVLYTDTSHMPWRDGSAIAQVAGAGSTLPWRLSQVRMAGVQRYSQANREAIERLNKLTLNDLSCTLEVFDIGIKHEVGDIVTVTHPVGLSSKLMRVNAVQMTALGRWVLALVEHDAAAYNSTVASGPSVNNTGFANPAGPPATPSGFTATAGVEGVVLSWTPNAEVDVVGYELRVGGTNWATASPLVGSAATRVYGTTYTWMPAAGTYTLRLCAVDNEGLLTTTPATVSGVVTVGPGTVATWTSITSRPTIFRVAAIGYSSTTHPIAAGLYNGETGSLVVSAEAMYRVVKIARSDGTVTSVGVWNPVGGGLSEANAMATALNAIGSSYIVVIFSSDEPMTNRLLGNLPAAMYRCGASQAVFGSPQFQYRGAYILVGIAGCGEGNGYEAYQGSVASDTNAWTDVAFYIYNGQLVISGTTATPRTLKDYSYTGSLTATGDLVLVAAGVCALAGNNAYITSIPTAWGSGQVYSVDAFTGGEFCSAVPSSSGTFAMGLNSDPTTNAHYTSIDFCIYFSGGTFQAIESGTDKTTATAFTAGDIFAIVYDGVTVKYLRNGAAFYTSVSGSITGTLKLYFDSAFAANNISEALNNIRFGPLSSVTDIGTGQIQTTAVSDKVLTTVSANLSYPPDSSALYTTSAIAVGTITATGGAVSCSVSSSVRCHVGNSAVNAITLIVTLYRNGSSISQYISAFARTSFYSDVAGNGYAIEVPFAHKVTEVLSGSQAYTIKVSMRCYNSSGTAVTPHSGATTDYILFVGDATVQELKR